MSPWATDVETGLLHAVHGGPGPGGLPPGVVDFSVNVNPFGPAPAAARAWTRADPVGYPDPWSLEVRDVAAPLWGLRRHQIRFGAGATGFLHEAALAWLAPGDVGVVPEPCFAEYGRAITLARGRVVSVPPADSAGTLDLDGVARAVRAHDARVVYLGRPNTPTGEAVEAQALRALVHDLPPSCLLVLDESFRSFEAGSVAAPPVLGPVPGVLSVRSITKDCALAGLRAGFAVAPASVLEVLDRVARPWAASAPAQLASRASLQPDSVAFLDGTLVQVRRELRRIEAVLSNLDPTLRASRANFACVEVPDADAMADALASRRMWVRRCASFGLENHVRIGVRSPAQNAALIDALQEMCARPPRPAAVPRNGRG